MQVFPLRGRVWLLREQGKGDKAKDQGKDVIYMGSLEKFVA